MITVGIQLVKARRTVVQVEKGLIGEAREMENIARSSWRRGGEE